MQLKREATVVIRLAGLVVVEDGYAHAIEPNFEVWTTSDNPIRVPRGGGPIERNVGRRLSKFLTPTATIRRDRDAIAAFSEELAAVFVIDAAEPGRALVDVGLITGCVTAG